MDTFNISREEIGTRTTTAGSVDPCCSATDLCCKVTQKISTEGTLNNNIAKRKKLTKDRNSLRKVLLTQLSRTVPEYGEIVTSRQSLNKTLENTLTYIDKLVKQNSDYDADNEQLLAENIKMSREIGELQGKVQALTVENERMKAYMEFRQWDEEAY